MVNNLINNFKRHISDNFGLYVVGGLLMIGLLTAVLKYSVYLRLFKIFFN